MAEIAVSLFESTSFWKQKLQWPATGSLKKRRPNFLLERPFPLNLKNSTFSRDATWLEKETAEVELFGKSWGKPGGSPGAGQGWTLWLSVNHV